MLEDPEVNPVVRRAGELIVAAIISQTEDVNSTNRNKIRPLSASLKEWSKGIVDGLQRLARFPAVSPMGDGQFWSAEIYAQQIVEQSRQDPN